MARKQAQHVQRPSSSPSEELPVKRPYGGLDPGSHPVGSVVKPTKPKESDEQRFGGVSKIIQEQMAKQMTEMMQLKADYHDANSELMQLRNKVTDLTMSIEEKERELEKAKEEVPSGSSGEQITELEAEKDKMESKKQNHGNQSYCNN